jgi:hypothetical protein
MIRVTPTWRDAAFRVSTAWIITRRPADSTAIRSPTYPDEFGAMPDKELRVTLRLLDQEQDRTRRACRLDEAVTSAHEPSARAEMSASRVRRHVITRKRFPVYRTG